MDSSGWVELFTNGPLTDRFLEVLATEAKLVMPAISILAAARARQAWLYTMDFEFKELHNVGLMMRS